MKRRAPAPFGDFMLVEDPWMPEGRIELRDGKGRLLAAIVNVEPPPVIPDIVEPDYVMRMTTSDWMTPWKPECCGGYTMPDFIAAMVGISRYICADCHRPIKRR